jgi:hypothetical protein
VERRRAVLVCRPPRDDQSGEVLQRSVLTGPKHGLSEITQYSVFRGLDHGVNSWLGNRVKGMNWRSVFGFDGEDLDFEMVHMRYRARLMETPPIDDVQELNKLNWALEEARKELVDKRPG